MEAFKLNVHDANGKVDVNALNGFTRALSQVQLYLGEVTQEEKVKLLQSCKALIYATTHPEITNHKLLEAMFCSAPVIAPRIGAQGEIVTNGVNGYLCRTQEEYLKAIVDIDKLEPEKKYAELIEKYSPQRVVSDYVELYKEVAGGLRW